MDDDQTTSSGCGKGVEKSDWITNLTTYLLIPGEEERLSGQQKG